MLHAMGRLVRNRRGSTVFFIVILLSILALVPVSVQLIQISQRETKQQLSVGAQADNVAQAGLIDAVSWFRRQPAQPVRSLVNPALYPYPDAAFYPRASTNPVTSDTLDESIGLVKEYELGEGTSLWARYEVRRQPDPSGNAYDPHAVHDITDRRVEGFSAGDGLCWYIESVGYIYRLRNSSVPYNQSPNEVVSHSRVATEIRRLSLTLPANAAVIVNNRGNVNINSAGRIVGGAAAVGLGYYQGTGGAGMAQVSGTPAIQDIDGAGVNGSISAQSVFGLTPKDLKLMADISAATAAGLPADYPSMAVVYIDGNAVFDASRQLRGGGILYVNGNLTINGSANTLFSGLIFVNGNATIGVPALISGAVIVRGNFSTTGTGDIAQIEYDSGILNSTRQQVGQYRENKASYHTYNAFTRS